MKTIKCEICETRYKEADGHACDPLSPIILNKRFISLEDIVGKTVTGYEQSSNSEIICLKFDDKFLVFDMRINKEFDNYVISQVKNIKDLGMKKGKELGIVSEEEFQAYLDYKENAIKFLDRCKEEMQGWANETKS